MKQIHQLKNTSNCVDFSSNYNFFLVKGLIVCLFATMILGVASCDEEEEAQAVESEFTGDWQSACGALLTEKDIAEVIGSPSNAELKAHLENFYKVQTLTFTTLEKRQEEAEDAESAALIQLPLMTQTVSVFYNSDLETAKLCQSGDLFSSQLDTFEYQLNSPATKLSLAVSEENLFPLHAKSINLLYIASFRSYENEETVETLNGYSICESSDWEVQTPRALNNARNCFESPVALTDALEYIRSPYIYDPNFSLYDWKSQFVAGRAVYSIFKKDDLTDPASVSFGIPLVDSDDSFTLEEEQAASLVDGSSEFKRHRTFGNAYTFVTE